MNRRQEESKGLRAILCRSAKEENKRNAVKNFTRTLAAVALVALAAAFTGCKRPLAQEVGAMENGPAKDSMLCYVVCGFYPGQPLVAVDTLALWEKPYDGTRPWPYNEITIGSGEYPGEIAVYKGDTLVPREMFVYETGAGDKTLMGGHKQRDKYVNSVRLDIVRGGQTVGTGWHDWDQHFVSNIAPTAWTGAWGGILGDFKGVVILLIIFGGAVVLLHRLGLWIFRLITDISVKDYGLWTHYVYLGCCLGIGAAGAFLGFNSSQAASLYYNPDIFAHWSEYSFVVKLLPFLLGLTALSMAGMLVEMVMKLKFGAIFHFPGVVAFGLLIIGLSLLATWIVYILLPTLIVLGILGLTGGGGGGGGGQSAAQKAEADRKERWKFQQQLWRQAGMDYTSSSGSIKNDKK